MDEVSVGETGAAGDGVAADGEAVVGVDNAAGLLGGFDWVDWDGAVSVASANSMVIGSGSTGI